MVSFISSAGSTARLTTLSELRLIYADTAKAVAQAVREGRIAPAPKAQPGQPPTT
jgi:hypothetical protein